MLVVLLGISCAMAFLAILLGTEVGICMGGQPCSCAETGGAEPADARKLQQWWMIVAVLIATVCLTECGAPLVGDRADQGNRHLEMPGRLRFSHCRRFSSVETLLLAAGGVWGGVAGALATVALFSAQLQADLWLSSAGRTRRGWWGFRSC